jgi:hypothetical protein
VHTFCFLISALCNFLNWFLYLADCKKATRLSFVCKNSTWHICQDHSMQSSHILLC